MITKHVERSAVNQFQVLVHDIILEKSLKFNDTPIVDSRILAKEQQYRAGYPDFILMDKGGKGGFLIEFKDTSWHPYDPEVVEDAFLKASRLNLKYFGTCNFNKLVIWKADLDVPLMEKYVLEYDLVKLRTINDLKSPIIISQLKKRLGEVIPELERIYYGKIIIKKKPIDEFFIELLRTAIDTFSFSISAEVQKNFKTKEKFKEDILAWFLEHGWKFEDNLDNYDKISKQYLLLLVNKMLFYNALRVHHPDLEEIRFTKDEDSTKFNEELKKYSASVLKIDYESIYSTNFIESIPIPDEIIPRLASFINSLSDKYDFSKVNYDIMGRIFENLIPSDERHKLGQYFTDSNIVDLINGFCIRSPDDLILDSSCGAGTFLVRAYNLKKMLYPTKKHEEIIQELYGFDISKFASHLTSINLTIKDLSAKESYPRIINDDFFNIRQNHIFKEYFKSKSLSGKLVNVKIPLMDCLVGNPPYTRQEELTQTFGIKYKQKLSNIIKGEFGITVDGQASIYVHFFIHNTTFLKERGRFGYITSNSWLDVTYGKTLKKFFLDNYRILAIIESGIERWFEYADINTSIIILEKCSEKNKRDNNLVKFVQFKDKLESYFSHVEASEELEITLKREKKRYNEIISLIKKINKGDLFLEDISIKIIPKKQKELYDEKKWSLYLRAPKIYFDLIKSDYMTRLDKRIKVVGGMITGDNDFFYIDKSKRTQYGLEEEYLLPVIKSPRDIKSILINSKEHKYSILNVTEPKSKLKGTQVLGYIEMGERSKINKKPTFKGRDPWYKINLKKAHLLWVDLRGNRHTTHFNEKLLPFEHNFYGLETIKESDNKIYCALLNSTLTWFYIEVLGRRGLGGGAIRLVKDDIVDFPIIDAEKLTKSQKDKILSLFEPMSKRNIKNCEEELKEKDRIKLDSYLFKILKFDKKQIKEIYSKTRELVKARYQIASSLENKKDTKTLSEEAIIENVINEIDKSKLKEFPNDFINPKTKTKEIELPKADNVFVASDLLYGFYVKADDKIIKAESVSQANYIKFLILNKKQITIIPYDKDELRRITKDYSNILKELEKSIKKALNFYTSNSKVKNKLEPIIFKRLFD
ncbi:MAG: N-6 DNA methylase [Nanoarchaeota archaeon]|nr:N-6 DNA methylase [Nanoarchaeota archaeon]